MIRMLWLYEGRIGVNQQNKERGKRIGALFILLDGVFLITNSEALRDSWHVRSCRNEILFHIERKLPKAGEFPEKGGPGVPAVFAGVEFHVGGGWRPVARRELCMRPDTVNTAASIVGTMLWDLRVRMESLLSWHTLRKLCRRIGSAESQRDSFTFEGDEIKTLRTLDQRRTSEELVKIPTLQQAELIVLAVTDATRIATGWCIFSDSGRVAQVSSYQQLTTPREQVHMEAKAVADLAHHLRNRNPDHASFCT
jgi:hypothetical protein